MAWAALLAAQLQVQQPSAPPERIVVALRVNGSPYGDAFVIRDGREIWLRATRLAGSGLARAEGRQREFNGEAYVALSSLAPAITFELDEETLELRLTATADMFEPTTIELQSHRPSGIDYSRTSSFFLNYDALFQQHSGSSATFEAGLSIGTALATTTISGNPDGTFVRGLSSVTLDRPSQLVRIVAGDTLARPTLLGSLPTVAGVSIGREFGLDPYHVPYPLPAVAGSVTTAATADVYINGQLTRRERLPPGAFSLQRLPVVGGLGSIQVVVRDSLGREQVFGGPYYFTTSLLEKGTQDFQYTFGAERHDEADANPTYGKLIGSFVHRVGLTDWLTLGARGEGNFDVLSGGPTIVMRMARLGEFEGEAAVSGSQGLVDYAAAGTYGYTTRRFTVHATAQWVRPHFATLDLAADEARHALRTNLTASTPIGRTTLTAFYSDSSGEIEPSASPQSVPVLVSTTPAVIPPEPSKPTPIRRAGGAAYLQLGPRGLLAISAAHVRSDLAPRGWDGFASLSVLLGPRAVASAGVNQSMDGRTSGAYTIQKSLPLGTGVAYRVDAENASDGGQSARGQFQVQQRYGLITLREESIGGTQTASAELSGSIVVAAGQVRLGRSITDGYAVVRVPDNPGVRVYVNNQLAGRTGRGGTLIVPNLLPYYANPVRIADEDISVEYQLDRTSALVAPPNRGAALVRFNAVLFRGVSGRLIVIDGDRRVVPAFGDVTIEAPGRGSEKSPIGGGGEFYLENVPQGRNAIRVDYRGGACRATINVPADIRIVVDVGEITCEREQQ